MPYHRIDFILINQAVSHGDRLFGFTGVIPLHQLDLFAIDPAGGVDVIGGLSRAVPVLIAIGGVWAGEGACDTDHNIRLGGKRRDHTTGQHKRNRASDEFQRHYDVPYQRSLGR
ncbi:hypothetical protein D3C76_1156260 [compost metagenome]